MPAAFSFNSAETRQHPVANATAHSVAQADQRARSPRDFSEERRISGSMCFQQIDQARFVILQLAVSWWSTQTLLEDLEHNPRIGYVLILYPVGIYFGDRVGVGKSLHKADFINGVGLSQRTIDIKDCQVHLELILCL